MSLTRIARLLGPVAVLALGACADQGPTETARAGDASYYTVPAEPVDGELIRKTGTATVYLSYGHTLWGIPNPQTLRACAGNRESVVREVSYLPAWQTRTLPAAGDPTRRPHGRAWLYGTRPVKNTAGTVYLVVGCVKSGIPDQATYNAIFNGDWSRIVDVPDADLNALPTGPTAQPVPLRRAGNLVESGGTIRWITFHGGSLGIPDPQTMDSYCRPWSDMVSNSTEYNAYQQKGLLQPGPASCLRGNDYPYAGQSYGTYRPAYDADPWQFWYRECTSFVAWRLNQDGVEFHNYYGGPHWGNADGWDDAARSLQSSNPGLGVRVDKTPRAGAVAQWNSMHVAYVAAVHNDGYVTIEEYNRSYDGRYGYRRIPASSVENYIHFTADR